MSLFLLVETRSHLESHRTSSFLNMALVMAEAGKQVDLWLMQNAVLLLKEAEAELFRRVLRAPGVRVFADEFAILQRGLALQPEESAGVNIASMDDFLDQMMDEHTKVIWH